MINQGNLPANDNTEIFFPAFNVKKLKRPYFLVPVEAGFPSPADDYVDKQLDLNDYLIHHPAATFFVRARGESMINAGIHNGDLLVVDRSIEARDGSIVIAVINGEFTVKRLKKNPDKILLMPENPEYTPIEIQAEDSFEIWGVVSNVIHSCL